MKKKVFLLGSSQFLQPIKLEETSNFYAIVATKLDMSLVSFMSSPINYDRQKFLLGKDKKLNSQLISEYEKDGLNDLIASNPDVLILDFFSDVKYGVVENIIGNFITNNNKKYVINPSFQGLKMSRAFHPLYEYDTYVKLWTGALAELMVFLKTYLPETKVVLNGGQEALKLSIIEGDLNNADFLMMVLNELNQFASETYSLPIISGEMNQIDFATQLTQLIYPDYENNHVNELAVLPTVSNESSSNKVYHWNLIRNPKFEREAEFWTNVGDISFDDDYIKLVDGELILHGERDKNALFSLLSAPINIGASPENPVELELSYDVFADDVFAIEIYRDYIFIGRGFEDNLSVSNNDAVQKIYEHQAKLLNLTSGKWKKINKIITVTAPFLRVGPFVMGNTTLKWRNFSLKHHREDSE